MKHPTIVPFRCVWWLVFTAALVVSAHASVTNVAWYRLGENDPGGVSGSVVTNTTTDLIGTNHLKQFGSPLYSSAVSTAAASQLGSSRSVNFNGTSQYLSNAVVSTAINNFGVEAWVKPNATAAGNRTIVYNGNPLVSGWGFIQRGGTEYRGSLGTMTAFGPGVAAAGVWAHLALVRDNGTTTFYVNGVASGTSVSNPIPPAVSFIVAAHPDLVANTYFNGAVDEIRVFTFAPGQFSTNDLLFNLQRATTLAATAISHTNATLNGHANPAGLSTSAWFQWGTTANYGNVTAPQSTGAISTNFSQVITTLAPGTPYHFRAVASNSLGVVFGLNRSFTAGIPTALYAENFETDHTPNWVVNASPGSHAADFFFDYSAAGIPPAPHSSGTTRGLKLEANYVGNTFGGLSVSPLGQNFTGEYVVTFDIWWNFVGPAPGGGNGSTQVTGAGVRTAGTTPQWAGGTQDSIYFGVSGDGGSAMDYRAYSPVVNLGYQAASGLYLETSGVYAAGTMSANAAYYAPLGTNIPPAAQTALFPQQTGNTATGAPAFRWHTGKIVNDGFTITLSLDDIPIATVNASAASGGNIFFDQYDVNSESSVDVNVRSLQFGLIDNVVVARPGVPQLSLNGVTRLGTGAIQLLGYGIPGRTYSVLASAEVSDLATGGTVIGSSVADAGGLIIFVDTGPPVPTRYYRLRWP